MAQEGNGSEDSASFERREYLTDEEREFHLELHQKLLERAKLKPPDYDTDDPKDLHAAVLYYRIAFYFPGFDLNKPQLKEATVAALRIRSNYPALPDIPIADWNKDPDQQDFVRLEKWFEDASAIDVARASRRAKSKTKRRYTRWQDVLSVAKSILAVKDFESKVKFARDIGCSKNTLGEAIENSDELKEMIRQSKIQRRTKKVVQLTDKVLAKYGKEKAEPLPSTTETNEILAELLEDARKKNPAKHEETKDDIAKMDPEARRRLAQLYSTKKTVLSEGGLERKREFNKSAVHRRSQRQHKKL